MYPDASEDTALKAPSPDKSLEGTDLTCFVDADHAHDKQNRRSFTGILIYFGSTPVEWISKKQKSVATSTYEAEYYALRVAVEKVTALRFVLRGFGIPTPNPTRV
eukprot:scaffold5908_cov181-Pinguiococcus_pyrenoidosus.AAC.2